MPLLLIVLAGRRGKAGERGRAEGTQGGAAGGRPKGPGAVGTEKVDASTLCGLKGIRLPSS